MKNSENKPIGEEKDPDFSTFTSRIHPTSELSPMAKAWLEKGTDDDDEATAIRRKEEAEAEEELNKGLKRMSRANILGIKGHLGRMGLGPSEVDASDVRSDARRSAPEGLTGFCQHMTDRLGCAGFHASLINGAGENIGCPHGKRGGGRIRRGDPSTKSHTRRP